MIRTTVLLTVAAAAVLSLLVVALWPVRSDVGDEVAIPREGSGPLDGLIFEGMFGPPDGSSDREDVLYFDDGHFWSKNCVPCGFLPGPYRAWTTDDGLRFEGVLTSPDRGRFHYQGVVKDERVFARLNWRKERWYWTIDKDFRFEGARAESLAADSANSVMQVALAASPEPDQCRP